MNTKSNEKSLRTPSAAKAKFSADTRGKTDRRKGEDRREEVRFEQGRRSGKDRRPRKTWADGNNL